MRKDKITNKKDNFTNKANTWKSKDKWEFLPFEEYERGEHFYITNKSSRKVAFHLHFFIFISMQIRSHFFYYDKSWNGKRCPFANVNSFWNLLRKTFFHLNRANSMETNLRTCNLRSGQFINYKSVNQFWLNLTYTKGKKFSTSNVKIDSDLQMDIFCHFDLCHSIEEMPSGSIFQCFLHK